MSIAPTLSLNQAASRIWPVLIIGAGPAGALAAREIARRGISVLLVDQSQFPRSKVCGCCVNGVALAALSSVGLASLQTQLRAVPLRSVILRAGRHEAKMPLPSGVALSREVLDTALIEAAIRAGAEFLPGTHAVPDDLAGSDEIRRVIMRRGEHERIVSASLLLVATGLTNLGSTATPGSRVGAGTILETDESAYPFGSIFMHCGTGGYVGMTRLEDGRLDVACAFDVHALRASAGPAKLTKRILMECGVEIPKGLPSARWRGTVPLTREADNISTHRCFVLGDAAGYVEPFTGEGIAWALTSAIAVAPLACQSWRAELARQWRQQMNLARRRQRLCRVAAWMLRRPNWTAALVALLSRWPALARPIIMGFNRPCSTFVSEVHIR